jgi:hypothetical protein
MSNTPTKTNEENKSEPAERIGPSSRSSPRRPMPRDFQPSPYSVVIGRGKKSADAVGNRRLLVLASSFLPQYIEAGESRREKTKIVSKLISVIRDANSDGDPFVKYEEGQWWAADGLAIREKIGTVFRNLLHDQYRSSTKSKVHIRRLKRESSTSSSVDDAKKPAIGVDPNAIGVDPNEDDSASSEPSKVPCFVASAYQDASLDQEHRNEAGTFGTLGPYKRPPSLAQGMEVARLSSAPVFLDPPRTLSLPKMGRAALSTSSVALDPFTKNNTTPKATVSARVPGSLGTHYPLELSPSSSRTLSPNMNQSSDGGRAISHPMNPYFHHMLPNVIPGGLPGESFMRSHASSKLLIQASQPFRPQTKSSRMPSLQQQQPQASGSSDSDNLPGLDEKQLPTDSSHVELPDEDLTDIFERPY